MIVERAVRERGAGEVARAGKAVGGLLQMPIEALRPTQMAVGMRAVTYKRRKLEGRAGKRRRLEEILAGRPIPTVLGPGGEHFIIDNHHFGLALWQAEVECVFTRVVDDLSHLGQASFWRRMEACGRLYPFDEEGQRVPPASLPAWLHGLRHDPFRDLAWVVREAGGFRKTPVPYAEFHWASFFREHISLGTVHRNPESAQARAMRLCRSRAAAGLPGFLDPRH